MPYVYELWNTWYRTDRNYMKLDLDIGYDLIDHGTSDDYYTPPNIFEALDVEFDIDVCAPPGGVPWIPAKRHYSVIEDGLSHDWIGKVWMNPPYSNPKPWVNKFIEHNNGIALVPTSTGQWMITFWASLATWLMLPPIKFVKSDLQPAKANMPLRCWLIAMGKENVDKLKDSGLGQVR